MLDVLTPAHVPHFLGGHLGQAETLVKLPVSQQARVARDPWLTKRISAELQKPTLDSVPYSSPIGSPSHQMPGRPPPRRFY
jgi:hypothetical protein